MSPSEFDLRAALRDGEGDSIDVDRVVAGGESLRARRRVQMLTASVAIVLVAAGAVTTAALAGHGPRGYVGEGGGHATSARSDAAGRSDKGARAQPSARASDAAPAASTASAAGRAATNIVCPVNFPGYPKHLRPSVDGRAVGSTGPLFSAPVQAVVICSYGSMLSRTAATVPGRVAVSGVAAAQLQTSLETAPTAPTRGQCPYIASTRRSYVFIGVDVDGRPEPPITATLDSGPCDPDPVTNGTATRYGWRPPRNLQTALLAIEPGNRIVASPHPPSSGRNHGSPIR